MNTYVSSEVLPNLNICPHSRPSPDKTPEMLRSLLPLGTHSSSGRPAGRAEAPLAYCRDRKLSLGEGTMPVPPISCCKAFSKWLTPQLKNLLWFPRVQKQQVHTTLLGI